MATIFDVAKKAKVSVITVSRLLNNPEIVSEKTANKIATAMEELHYQPSQIARSLVKKRTNTIGVIMSDIKNTFFNSWFRIIEDYASSHGFNLVLCNTDEDPSKEIKYIKLLQSQRVDGIIIVPCAEKSVDYLLKSHIHFILVDRVLKPNKVNYVSTDHYAGAFEATEYLIKLGHKKIAVLKGPGILYPDKERYTGFEEAMKKHKIKIEKGFVLNCEFDETKAYEATLELLKSNLKPTALFTFNSKMMNGSIKATQSLGLTIPRDISLISFDQIPGHEIFRPQISCVTQPIKLLGIDSITALINKIKNDGAATVRKILEPQLVIGNSCKKIKK
jgi:LacI family transcriptional regulator, galactose operon repressor